MPSGLAGLCKRDPSFCSAVRAPPHDLNLSPARWDLLNSVNLSINHRITSTTDLQLYGTAEYWTIPETAGDCEDYVLLKRQTLARQGVPEASLLITVVHDENGEGHAVLTVPTAGGDLVLDNRRDEILPWWATGYDFVKRQSEADPELWVSLGHEERQTTNIASGPNRP
ncbi:transglutaminase-like cysteine peptidase [Aestuariivirga sp.]|uniref:transglutaminase-like cysteine peptidase n=1 Tax=Aestuariivirga sp. TaxID=2650926 RepID=UPI003BA99F3A